MHTLFQAANLVPAHPWQQESNEFAAVIIDDVGNVFRLGLPGAPYDWPSGSKKRSQAERQQAAAIWLCPARCEVRCVCPMLGADIRTAGGRQWFLS